MDFNKTIRYRTIDASYMIPQGPKLITLEQIEKIDDIKVLKNMEKNYDDYLDKNCQILLLHNIVDTYLEIRDNLTLKISRIERINKKIDIPNDELSLPLSLQLTNNQRHDGYQKGENEPQIHKCGCITCKYYCFQKPDIKLFNYCSEHMRLKRKLERLEREVEDIKYNLSKF